MSKKSPQSTTKPKKTATGDPSNAIAAAFGFRPEHFGNKSQPEFDVIAAMFEARWETHHLAQKILFACEKAISVNKHKGKQRHLSEAEQALIYLEVEARLCLAKF